jgi:hypothetical protein
VWASLMHFKCLLLCVCFFKKVCRDTGWPQEKHSGQTIGIYFKAPCVMPFAVAED